MSLSWRHKVSSSPSTATPTHGCSPWFPVSTNSTAGRKSYFWLAQRLARGQQANGGSTPHGGAFAAITAGLTDLQDARRAGGTAPLQELTEAAAHARLRAGTRGPMALP
jgi:hypothetical protein